MTQKSDAQSEGEKIRIAIRAGTFRQARPTDDNPATSDAISFEKYAAIFYDRYTKPRGKVTTTNDQAMLKRLAAFVPLGATVPLGAKAIGAITEDDLELFFQHLREQGRAASTRNGYVQIVKAMFRWAVKKKYLTRNPISEDSEIKREKMNRRNRRLASGEEGRLLMAATPRLQRLIVAALDTGARLGELLSLQWSEVTLDRRKPEILFPKTKTKDREDRTIPISARLLRVLQAARHDPAGEDFPPTAYVFGDEIGRRIASPKKAWTTAILKAHGHKPEWAKGTHRLMPESQAAYRAIGLHFHDLRHEAGSRFLERGFPLHEVQAMLGHANIRTTSTYLNVTLPGLHVSMRRFNTISRAEQKAADKAARKSCKVVASSPAIEQPPSRNSERRIGGQPLVH